MGQITVAEVGVVRKAVFDLKDFYFTMYNFIKDVLGFADFSEDTYYQWEKEHGTDIEFHWTFIRNQEEYIDYRVWIECKVRGMKKVTKKVGDKTLPLNDCEVEFNIKGVLVTDPGGKWAKHPVLKHFQKFYEEFIYRKNIESYWERLYEYVYNVENEVKAFFNLPKF